MPSISQPENLKQLTALRFFAAMWVVLYHFWPSLGLAMPAVIGKGYLGVELFFVLSGFILCHVYLEPFGRKSFRYIDFLWARLARIYPVHVAIIAGLIVLLLGAAAVGVHAGENVLIWPSLGPQLLLMQAWGATPLGGWDHPSWSISAEWFAYLLFPAFATATWALRRRPVIATALVLVGMVAIYEVFARISGQSLTHATIAWGALRIVPCFALGCAVHLLWRSGVIQSRRAAMAAAAFALAEIAALSLSSAPDWASVMAFGLLILSIAAMSSLGSRLLTAKPWVYLGEVSFAVYMVCIPWKLLVENGAHKLLHLPGDTLPLPLWGVLLVGVVPAAMIVHHLVERPARDVMRKHGAPFTRPSPFKARLSKLSPIL